MLGVYHIITKIANPQFFLKGNLFVDFLRLGAGTKTELFHYQSNVNIDTSVNVLFSCGSARELYT